MWNLTNVLRMCFKKNSCEIGGARDTSWAYQHIWALESPPAQPNQQCPTGLEGKLWASVGLTSSDGSPPLPPVRRLPPANPHRVRLGLIASSRPDNDAPPPSSAAYSEETLEGSGAALSRSPPRLPPKTLSRLAGGRRRVSFGDVGAHRHQRGRHRGGSPHRQVPPHHQELPQALQVSVPASRACLISGLSVVSDDTVLSWRIGAVGLLVWFYF